MAELDKEIVALAHQLIVGYELEDPEKIEKIATEVDSIQTLRSRLMLHFDTRRQMEMLRVMEFFYGHSEAQEKADEIAMEAFLHLGSETETAILAAIDEREDKYTRFHRLRFFDQIRALGAIRTKVFGNLSEVNVLDIGVMSVSGMYSKMIGGLHLHTCDHPRRVAQNTDHGSLDFYPVDLETEDVGTKYPDLIGKFHVIMFCEVLEHLKLLPSEILGDFKKLLAPGGMIYLTTPNGLGYGVLLAYFSGRSPVVRYSRANRTAHMENFIHVREYTSKELAMEFQAASLSIKHHATREYFHPNSLWPSAFVSGRSLLTYIAQAGS